MSAPPYAFGPTTWSFPEEVTEKVTEKVTEEVTEEETSSSYPEGQSPLPGSFVPEEFSYENEREPGEKEPPGPPPEPEASSSSNAAPKPQKHYGSRTCRICLEVVQPTFETGPEGIAAALSPTPTVQYISEDRESGRLIRPCKCKGSQSYVHEGCLQNWRHADPSYGRRNYFECPTCKYAYRLERMRWSKWIGSTMNQVVLTLLILGTTVFLLGFVADLIFNLYLDPVGTLTTNPMTTLREPVLVLDESEEWTWVEHTLKGLASLGLLGFANVVGPWQWHTIKNVVGGGGRARRAGAGRDRLDNISWPLILIGVLTFLYVSLTDVRILIIR